MGQREIKVLRRDIKLKKCLVIEVDGNYSRTFNTNSISGLAKAMIKEGIELFITDIFVGESARYSYATDNANDALTNAELSSLVNDYWTFRTRQLKKEAYHM
jgi:hypothetical protein